MEVQRTFCALTPSLTTFRTCIVVAAKRGLKFELFFKKKA